MDEITLINLLNELTRHNKHLSWSIKCQYQNNHGHTCLEIQIMEKYPAQLKGVIPFRMENGKVEEFSYEHFHPAVPPAHITDLLLDIINFENARSFATSN